MSVYIYCRYAMSFLWFYQQARRSFKEIIYCIYEEVAVQIYRLYETSSSMP
jgi:hypothetical protein